MNETALNGRRLGLNQSTATNTRSNAWLLVVATVLAACAGESEELAAWTEQQRREVKPGVPPLVAPKPFCRTLTQARKLSSPSARRN